MVFTVGVPSQLLVGGMFLMKRGVLLRGFFRTLGAMTDLRLFPNGPIKRLSAIERVGATISDLENILTESGSHPTSGGKLYGRMQWASSTIFLVGWAVL